MIYVLKNGEGVSQIRGNPTLDKLDGSGRARFKSVTSDGWPEGFAALFGVFEVVTVPPEGKQWLGEFDGSVAPPVAVFEDVPPLYLTADQARLAMTTWINRLTGQIQDEYPDVVQKGWEDEEAMAAAFEAGTMTQEQTAILSDDAEAKGRTPAEHAARIVQKATAFRSIALRTRTLWLATDKALEAATDPSEYEGILATAIEQAAPLAAAYGLSV